MYLNSMPLKKCSFSATQIGAKPGHESPANVNFVSWAAWAGDSNANRPSSANMAYVNFFTVISVVMLMGQK